MDRKFPDKVFKFPSDLDYSLKTDHKTEIYVAMLKNRGQTIHVDIRHES